MITTARQRLSIQPGCTTEPYYPSQPLLISIANLTRTGCSAYYKLLRKKKNLSNSTSIREAKWHTELGCIFGIEFWGRTYTLISNLKYENKMKWLQFQINRNSLFTNYKVNKFKPGISPLCSFCRHHENFPRSELVSHLFYECDYVQNLWLSIKTWLAPLNTVFPLERAKLLFGIHSEPCNSVLNYTILCAKSYIWKAKFTTKDLTLESFQKYFYLKLISIKNVYLLMGKENRFDIWINVFNCLSRLPGCIEGSLEATLPSQEQEAPRTDPV